MNADSVIEDESRISSDLTDEQILTWYKNMLTGEDRSEYRLASHC